MSRDFSLGAKYHRRSQELNFTPFGTTLRGARQQRGNNPGWATWDDAEGPFTYDPANSHIDAP